MLVATAHRKNRKEPRQARLRSSWMQSGSVILLWPRAAFRPCYAHRSRCMEPPLPTLQPDTVSLPPSAVPELNDCSWPIGARLVPTCDFSELTNILPISMSLSIVSAAWLISSGFAREAGYPWSMPDDSRPRYASLLWPVRRLILLRGNPDCRLSPRRPP